MIVLYSSTIQPKTERDLKFTRLFGIISPYLAILMKYKKLNIALLHESVTNFSPFYL